ncbi:MAG: hypothetical protein ACFFDB_19800 [Promethearchaeota archaeon]
MKFKKSYFNLSILFLLSIGFLFNLYLMDSWNESHFTDSFNKDRLKSSWYLKWIDSGLPIWTGGGEYPGVLCYENQDKFFIWSDGDIYIKRMDGMTEHVKTIFLSDESGTQRRPKQCSDDNLGSIICWEDERTPANSFDIYMQKVNSSGDSVWLEDGIVICSDSAFQRDAEICKDGFGGAIIAWLDDRPGGMNTHIYAQRVNSTGHIQWDLNGKAICTAVGDKAHIQLLSDGNGGAFIVWADRRNSNLDIFAQHINSEGIGQWTNNGVLISGTTEMEQTPQLCSDLNGGLFITWDSTSNEVYAQRLNQTGDPQWTTDGVKVCISSGDKSSPKIISDDQGGAIITWREIRDPLYDEDIYAQRIDSNGMKQWTDNGTAICIATGTQFSPVICSDGGGGAIITWSDLESEDIYGQRVNSEGITKWTEYGFYGYPICIYGSDQYSPQICSDNEGGAVIVWYDSRSGGGLYAQKIKNSIPTSNHPNNVTANINADISIGWRLTDDCGGGKYRVLQNGSLWIDWVPWSNYTSLNVPVNTSNIGISNYVIEFYDDQNQYGLSDTVQITIKPQIGTIGTPVGFYIITLAIVGIISVILMRRKLFK